MVEYIGAEYPRGKKKLKNMGDGMSDSQLKNFMTKDPEAAKFLD